MTNLKRKLLALAMVAVVSAGAFAQKGKGEDKRPPKNPDTKVVVSPKGERPPPKNNNQDKPKNDGRKGRP